MSPSFPASTSPDPFSDLFAYKANCEVVARTKGPDSQPACLDSAELLRGRKAVEIRHQGLTYRLQATRLGKLILTK